MDNKDAQLLALIDENVVSCYNCVYVTRNVSVYYVKTYRADA